ncbi:hypothetical protein C8J56DRAFT_1026336 [Mycena floridula]|nr:hypothetical protein C8J56DRAFT_1026336 [Mycena floridula]
MDADDEADIHCVGLTQGQSCDCEFFTEPVDLAGLYVCRECGHGPSKHKKRRKSVLPSVSALATPIASAPVAVAPAIHSKSSISAIFQKHASKLEVKPTESIFFDDARADALEGYRPGTPASKSKKDKSKPGHNLPVARKNWYMSTVLSLCEPPSKNKPKNSSMQHCLSESLLIILQLIRILPVPFVHFHTDATVVARKKVQALWVLLAKVPNRNQLAVVPVDQPTGHELFRHKGGKPSLLSSSLSDDESSQGSSSDSSDYVSLNVNLSRGSSQIETRSRHVEANLKRRLEMEGNDRPLKRRCISNLSMDMQEFNMLRVSPPPRLVAPEPSGSWLYSWSSNGIISPWKTGYKLDTLYPKPKNVLKHKYPLTNYPVLVR